MVVAHKRGDLGEGGVLSNHVRPDVRVPPHDLPLLFRQRAWLVEDVIANSDLAEVVQRASGADELALPIAELKLLTQSTRKLRYTNRMRLRVPIASVQGLCC